METREISRWKLLRMKICEADGFTNRNLGISHEEFMQFAKKYRGEKVIVEDSLANTYIIVDNCGNLLDNTAETYRKVGNLLKTPFEELFGRYPFKRKEYESRYSSASTG